MIAATERQLLAMFVIAAGVCVGGYELFAAPAKLRRAQAQQDAEVLRSHISQVNRTFQAGPLLRKRAEECRLTADAMQRLAAAGRDEAALFATIESLASGCSVTVERITPLRTRSAAASSDQADAADKAFGMELTLHADYADLVHFVRALQHGIGICRLESVSIAPDTAHDGSGITASIRLTTFVITVADIDPSQQLQEGAR